MATKQTFRVSVPGFGSVVFSVEPVNGEPAAPGPKTDTGPRMTENQKRFIFRLLAGQKVEGKDAERHLLDYFKVRSFSEIGKQEASQYIEELVRDQKDSGK
jgi:hypothetical protein